MFERANENARTFRLSCSIDASDPTAPRAAINEVAPPEQLRPAFYLRATL
jgi:hypothetical protein